MNWDLISLLVFYFIIFIFYHKNKEKFEVQGGIFFLYKTKFGLKLMKKISDLSPKLLKGLSSIGVIVGFGGMVFIFVFLIKATLELLFVPGTEPALAPVLPGISIPGFPALGFWHWIIALFIAAVIHEFAHGIISKLYHIRIKSSGFAFMGPILAAFVEPDENELVKSSKWQQLSVYAAGPFINILLGIFVLLFIGFVFAPLLSGIYDSNGIVISEVIDGYPVYDSGIELPFVITSINGVEVLDVNDFVDATEDLKPDEEVLLGTDKGEYELILVENPDNVSKGFFGMSGFAQKNEIKEKYDFYGFDSFIQWTYLLLIWLFLINIGVGLFNLLPLGPVDGGRMFYTLALWKFKNEKYAKRALLWISIFILGLIIINMLPWITKLLVWILGIFGVLIALF